MTTVGEVLDFLVRIGEAAPVQGRDAGWLATELTGVNTDTEASQGELAWVSPKQVRIRPTASTSFRGGLLICPDGLEAIPPLVPCNNPKVAFVRVLDTFFGHLARIAWPVSVTDPIHPSAVIDESAILSTGVIIGSGVVIEAGVKIGPNTVIANCTVGRGTHIGANCSIGLPGLGLATDHTGRHWRFPHIGRVEIGEDVEIGSNTCIDRGTIGNTVIGRGAKISNLVYIAHNAVVGAYTVVIGNSMISGSTQIGEHVWIAPSVTVMNQISVGKSATLGMGAVVIKDVAEMAVMVGNPAKVLRRKDPIDEYKPG